MHNSTFALAIDPDQVATANPFNDTLFKAFDPDLAAAADTLNNTVFKDQKIDLSCSTTCFECSRAIERDKEKMSNNLHQSLNCKCFSMQSILSL